VAFNRRSAREKKRAREGVVYLSERVLSRDPLRSAGSHTLDGHGRRREMSKLLELCALETPVMKNTSG